MPKLPAENQKKISKEFNTMKTVYPAKELPHLFVHQTQGHARAGNISFNENCYLSYSTVICRIIKNRRGERAFLMDNWNFSNSTAKHKNDLRCAIPAGEKVFYVTGGRRGQCLEFSGREIFDDTVKRAAELSNKAKRARSSRAWLESAAADTLVEARDIAKFFGLRCKIDEKTFERLANRQRANERKLAAAAKERARLAEIANAEAVQKWLAGESNHFPYAVEKVCLRVEDIGITSDKNGKELVTSRGARVPLCDAEKAFRFAIARRAKGWHKNGETCAVGNYQLDAINESGIVAGCHRISWDEVERFAKLQGWI